MLHTYTWPRLGAGHRVGIQNLPAGGPPTADRRHIHTYIYRYAGERPRVPSEANIADLKTRFEKWARFYQGMAGVINAGKLTEQPMQLPPMGTGAMALRDWLLTMRERL